MSLTETTFVVVGAPTNFSKWDRQLLEVASLRTEIDPTRAIDEYRRRTGRSFI